MCQLAGHNRRFDGFGSCKMRLMGIQSNGTIICSRIGWFVQAWQQRGPRRYSFREVWLHNFYTLFNNTIFNNSILRSCFLSIRKNEISTKTSELEELEARLRATEERLKAKQAAAIPGILSPGNPASRQQQSTDGPISPLEPKFENNITSRGAGISGESLASRPAAPKPEQSYTTALASHIPGALPPTPGASEGEYELDDGDRTSADYVIVTKDGDVPPTGTEWILPVLLHNFTYLTPFGSSYHYRYCFSRIRYSPTGGSFNCLTTSLHSWRYFRFLNSTSTTFPSLILEYERWILRVGFAGFALYIPWTIPIERRISKLGINRFIIRTKD